MMAELRMTAWQRTPYTSINPKLIWMAWLTLAIVIGSTTPKHLISRCRSTGRIWSRRTTDRISRPLLREGSTTTSTADGVLDVRNVLLVGLPLAITALERRVTDEIAVLIALDDDGKGHVLHAKSIFFAIDEGKQPLAARLNRANDTTSLGARIYSGDQSGVSALDALE